MSCVGHTIFHYSFLANRYAFLFLKNAEFSVDTVCLLLCFGWDKGKKMRFSVEGDCSDGTTVIFIKADRFAIIVVNGIIYQRTTVWVNSCISADNNLLSHVYSSIDGYGKEENLHIIKFMAHLTIPNGILLLVRPVFQKLAGSISSFLIGCLLEHADQAGQPIRWRSLLSYSRTCFLY